MEFKFKCSDCGETRDTKADRLPQGWKRRKSDRVIFCNKCWRKRYILRAIAIPVASPMDMKWDEWDAVIRPRWAATTNASNWMMTQLYVRDVHRDGKLEKLPPMEKQYLYPEVSRMFPNLPPRSRAALEQSVQKRYRKIRYDVVWTSQQSLPTFKYPTPFSLPEQAWEAELENDQPVVHMVFTDNEHHRLRLRGGSEFYRQRHAFDQLTAGLAEKCDITIYKRADATMVKMVMWIPRPEFQKGRTGTLVLRTAEDALIEAVNFKDERIWMYHGDHIRRWAAEHENRLQRWSNDTKFEQRPTPALKDRRAAAARKYHDRMDSACHEIAAHIAGYADRRKFAAVEYTDTEKKYCKQFPFAQLRELIRDKLDVVGIEFIHHGEKETEEETVGVGNTKKPTRKKKSKV